jgi:acyl-CoA synthetase (AMP-forming)/AMP-acid ligase II
MSRLNNEIRVFPYEQEILKELNNEGYNSLVDMFEEACDQYADRQAFTAIGQTLTFADIERHSRDFAAYLVGDAGLVPGQHIAMLQYTGGTTGVAKGAVLTHGNILASTCQSGAIVKIDPEDPEIVIAPMPLYH